ncbi:hypothetical protein [Celeribacter arenosi]|uniref:Uncharacterized protein n=1 Tax=Celeribacter arenosi TaxID=792649 RepID=A0ABP7KGU1_9RHOB
MNGTIAHSNPTSVTYLRDSPVEVEVWMLNADTRTTTERLKKTHADTRATLAKANGTTGA